MLFLSVVSARLASADVTLGPTASPPSSSSGGGGGINYALLSAIVFLLIVLLVGIGAVASSLCRDSRTRDEVWNDICGAKIGKRQAVTDEALKELGFNSFREVSGDDGNGYYRGIGYAVIEALTRNGQRNALDHLAAKFVNLEVDQALIDELASPDPTRKLQKHDSALVRATRNLVAQFLFENSSLTLPRVIGKLRAACDAAHGESSSSSTTPASSHLPVFSSGNSHARRGDDEDLTLEVALGWRKEDSHRRIASAIGRDADGIVCNLPILANLMGAESQIWMTGNSDQISPFSIGCRAHPTPEAVKTTGLRTGTPPCVHLLINPAGPDFKILYHASSSSLYANSHKSFTSSDQQGDNSYSSSFEVMSPAVTVALRPSSVSSSLPADAP